MTPDPEARLRRLEAADARRREAWADARRRIAEAREQKENPATTKEQNR